MKQTEFVVLDEADRLFEEKTLPNMRSIMQAMPNLKQCVLATATIDSNFQANRLKSLLSFGVCFVKYSTYTTNLTVRTLTQSYIFTPEALKPSYLLELLEQNRPYKIIVFVKTCRECTLMFETLQKLGHSVTQLHSSMKNSQRIGNLAMFRSDQVSILVTTDLTSRGLDIAMVNMVINYNIPKTVSDYVHRVGRTARNGHEGEAVTFVTPQEIDIFKQIEEKIGVTITAHELDGQTQLELVSQYNKVKRAVKIELVSNGVLGDL